MAELIDEWREEYNYVIIDSPPILMVSDALEVASRADDAVMIIRAGLTRKKAITRSFELLSRSKIHILGAIINDIDLDIENLYTYSSRGYGYKYYGENGRGLANGNRD
jgi:Mrp family chromosome partitioning ATPase